MPYRTGRGYRQMLGGVRVFGTSFNNLRGYIVGPSYMRAHEEGATIVPVRAKALTIPLPPALKADGTPKLPGPRSWQNVLDTFIYRSKKTGRAYIAYRNRTGGLTLLYVLVSEVQLRTHKGWLSRAFNKQKPALMEAVGQAMLFEMSSVDLLDLARVTYRGRRK